MNAEVRKGIDAQLEQKGMTRADLARAIGKTPQTVTRALNGNEGGGTVPPLWAAMLDALGLELIAVPKGSISHPATSALGSAGGEA